MAYAQPSPEAFGPLLHRLRLARGLRLRDLGPPSTIESYETGRRIPHNVALVRRLAARLGVDDAVLLAPLGPTPYSNPAWSEWQTLLHDNPRKAAAAARHRVRAAIAAADTPAAVQWDYAYNRALATQALIPLPLSDEGRLSVPDLITAAGHAVAVDAWRTALVLLEAARPLVLPANPCFGYYAALAAQLLSAQGAWAEADRYARAAYDHACAEPDPWKAMLAAAIVVLNATRHTPVRLPEDMLQVLDDWRRPDGHPDPLVQAWVLDARARLALDVGDAGQVRQLSRRLTRLLQAEPTVEPEAHRIIEMAAWALALDGRPAEGMGHLDQALLRAVTLEMPGFQLLDSFLSDCRLAWQAGDARAPRQTEWLLTVLAARGAEQRAAVLPGKPEGGTPPDARLFRSFGTFLALS